MKEIFLTNGLVAFVDDDDYDSVACWGWHARPGKNTTYAYRAVKIKGKQKNILLHRMIMGHPEGKNVDHINGNGLDCQKGNLRLATGRENNANAKGNRNATSKYKGVSWHTKYGKWRAVISDYKPCRHIMMSECEVTCAKAYDEAARKAFGEYAMLNFPDDGKPSAMTNT